MDYDVSNSNYESEIVDKVIDKIDRYIEIIKPNLSVYIAFDGVAPFAKMDQQRTRRYKSDFMARNVFDADVNKDTWNTSAITPGTEIMEMLSKRIEYVFKHSELKYNLQKIYVSCSNEIGEGEHKLMEHIRDIHNKDFHDNKNIAIYGLDSDLIMLSLFHLDYCKNIYVFREAPEFLKSAIPTNIISNTSDLYFLDIEMLSHSIVKEMNCKFSDKRRTYDYVFMCFLLGNDFLPHFPAMNIRTHGISVLMEIYKNLLGSHSDRFFVSQDKKIQWRHVSSFVNEIAKNEHQYLINEYFLRDKWDKRQFSDSTPKERDDLLSNVPLLYRSEEKYISPNEYGWEKRYYNILLGESDTKMIAMNYIEGLEWVLKYYTQGCPDWKWKYQYNYPPLFSDLKIYIPHFEMDFIKPSKNNHSFSPQLQLAYVLPKSQLHLLPKKIKDFLLKNYGEYYPVEYQMQWAFCRYFWESHPQLPEIPLNLLEQWDTQFRLSMTA